MDIDEVLSNIIQDGSARVSFFKTMQLKSILRWPSIAPRN